MTSSTQRITSLSNGDVDRTRYNNGSAGGGETTWIHGAAVRQATSVMDITVGPEIPKVGCLL